MEYVAIVLFLFVGFVAIYGAAAALVKSINYLRAKPWVALALIALLGAALVAQIARPEASGSIFETVRYRARAPHHQNYDL